MPEFQTNLIIVMGVSGCGKSAVANALAERYGYEMIDADDFHSPQNKAQMAAGIPLTEAMRDPWIGALETVIKQRFDTGAGCVLSFSALRHAHRARIRKLPGRCVFVYLAGDKSTIARRISKRRDHFMPGSLLDSQFATLEIPTGEADTVTIQTQQPLSSVVEQAFQQSTAALELKTPRQPGRAIANHGP